MLNFLMSLVACGVVNLQAHVMAGAAISAYERNSSATCQDHAQTSSAVVLPIYTNDIISESSIIECNRHT